jgi:hypothetical protein
MMHRLLGLKRGQRSTSALCSSTVAVTWFRCLQCGLTGALLQLNDTVSISVYTKHRKRIKVFLNVFSPDNVIEKKNLIEKKMFKSTTGKSGSTDKNRPRLKYLVATGLSTRFHVTSVYTLRLSIVMSLCRRLQ